MSDDDKDIMVTQFQDVTGEDAERSRFFLESSGWDLEVALGSFYEGDAMEVEDLEAARPQPQKAEDQPKAKPATNINTFSSRFGASAEGKAGDDDDDDSSDDEGQAFFAGGSETSGQQILGPPKKKEGADFVKKMFKKAREHGAEAVDPNSAFGRASGSRSIAFSGSGFTLGSSESSSERVEGSQSKREEKPREFILKMWQNGFSIDDGPLRAYNDEANSEFLRSVMTGRIPKELVKEAKGGEVMVNMEDHKDTPYEAPKVKVKPFQGAGNVLGSIAPNVDPERVPAQRKVENSGSAAMDEAEVQDKLKVDKSKPLCTVQVRLADGGRLVVKLNESNTVGDLRRYVELSRPCAASTAFALHTTFPNKELDDEDKTLKDAGLIGAAVLMRAKR